MNDLLLGCLVNLRLTEEDLASQLPGNKRGYHKDQDDEEDTRFEQGYLTLRNTTGSMLTKLASYFEDLTFEYVKDTLSQQILD